MATMELIMERIRSKASQYKSFSECAKTVRMSQLEKRFPMDIADRHQLQKCLDTLQQSMKVTTLQGIVERLESISRQLNLKLMPGPTGLELFISSDMFYLEVSLEHSGNIKDVKIHHEGKLEQQSCDELVKSLSKGDFEDFTIQLQGLISIYQLNAEKKVKCKAFSALCALETDLDAYWSSQVSTTKNVQIHLNKSPVGVLEKRKGGHPMKLTYFVSPYEVLEVKKELSVEMIYKSKIGSSVTICLEGSAAHKLQIAPLVTVNKNSNKSSIIYASMTPANSTTLPAYFTLKLNKPQPICLELVKRINIISELECCDISNPLPLFSLITQYASNGKMDSSLNKGLFVNLPDQVHCYFMTECKGLGGVMLSSIPFTHPSHVPPILSILRQQAMFNALISSVIRPHSKQDIENTIMFEVSALSCQHISVSFEHPLQESMSTIEIDLSDVLFARAKLYSTTAESNPKTTTEHISKILQRCLSIPVTMRYLLKTLQNQTLDTGLNSINNGHFSSAPNGGLGNGSDLSPMDTSKIKQEPGSGNNMNARNETLRNQFDDFSSFSNSVLDNNMQKNTNLLSVVTDQQKHKKKKHEKPWKSSKSQRPMEDCEILLESSSNDSVSAGTPMEVDLEPDFLSKDKEDLSEIGEVDDVEEMLKATAGPARTDIKLKKSKEMRKSPSRSSLIMDLTDGKGLVPPSVTITPITSNTPNINSVLERRPGIEIIPLSGSSTLASSITITPISSSLDKDERKNYKNRNVDDKVREKKRKRKREEESGSKMGPPEKVPAKSDPLSKPVSVSIIKPSTDSPPSINRPSSPSVRKYSASPTQFREKSSSSNFQPSPKHSPAYGSSPKHSPKHGTSSPKQASSSSGKPSMSTLKSASGPTGGLKNSEGKMKSSSGGSSGTGNTSGIGKDQRDKDSSRKSSGSSSSSSSSGSPKIKSSSVKLKQLDISSEITATISGRSTPPNISSAGDAKNLGNPLQRNRKGSLSAVIDKLKSAQEVGDPGTCSPKRDSPNSGTAKDGKIPSTISSTTISKIGLDGKAVTIQKIPDGVKNPGEYMVKQSSDGMKLLINKKSKESSKGAKSPGSSGTGSPKTHTGLKPGVLSGPASKKPTSSKSINIGGTSSKGASSIVKGPSALKGALSKSLSSKGSGSPKMPGSISADLPRKESSGKSRSLKTNPEKGLFKEGVRKGSPAPPRNSDEDHDRALKAIKIESGFPPSLVVEGLIKPFDTKFQIPKLSARNSSSNTGNNNSSGGGGSGSNSTSTSVSGNSSGGSSNANINIGSISSNTGTCNNSSSSSVVNASSVSASSTSSNVGNENSVIINTNSSNVASLVNSSTGSNNNSSSGSSGISNVGSTLSESSSAGPAPLDSNEPNATPVAPAVSSSNNNSVSIIKPSHEKIADKPENKHADLPASKASLDIAATLKYQTSKHDAKVPSSSVPNLLSLPMALTNVSPKLPMTSPNLPTTSLSSITSKLDRGEDPGLIETPIGDKLDIDGTSTVDVTSVKFQSASLMKPDELKKQTSTEVSKHLITSQSSSDILLDFSSSLSGKMLPEKPDKTLVGTTPSSFIKPNSPSLFHKSPGESPMAVATQSPQSITDDELMDEALMLRK